MSVGQARYDELVAENERLRAALEELHAAGVALVPHMGYVSAGPSIRWDEAMSAAASALHWKDRPEGETT